MTEFIYMDDPDDPNGDVDKDYTLIEIAYQLKRIADLLEKSHNCTNATEEKQ